MNPALGFSLRAPWLNAAAHGALGDDRPVEIIADQWLFADDDALRPLDAIRGRGPMFLHALGFNLGSVDGLDPEYVDRVGRLAERFDVDVVSGHFAWRSVDQQWSATFLPLPTRPDVLDHVAARVHAVQARLGRPIALETPSMYVRPQASTMSEVQALRALHDRCGASILVDVTNLQVTARNVGLPIADAIEALAPMTAYVHVAGFATGGDGALDDHGSPPSDATLRWAASIDRPAILEWDRGMPDSVALGRTLAEMTARMRKASEEPAPLLSEPRPSITADGAAPYRNLADWQRAFMARVMEGRRHGFRTLFAEQVFSALDSLTEAFPRTAEVFGADFRVLVRDLVRTEAAHDVHGQTWIPRLAHFLLTQDGLHQHPEYSALREEWSAYG